MQIKPNSFEIILVGRWNPYILNPQWIAEHLFEHKAQVQIEFSLNLDLPNRYKIHNVQITPTPEKVVFSSFDNSDESLLLMGRVAVKLCNILSHTPLMAIGVNFVYIESENKEGLYEKFGFDKNDAFSDDGWEVKTQGFSRFLVKGDYNLNLKVSLDRQNNFNFGFNYHYNIRKREKIIELLENQTVILYRDNSLELLDTIYNLKLKAND